MSLNRPSSVPFWCPLCVGNGTVERCECDDGQVECEDCEGMEYQACSTCEGKRTSAHKECEGEGWKICPRCDSHGRVFGLMPWEKKHSRKGWNDDGTIIHAILNPPFTGQGDDR